MGLILRQTRHTAEDHGTQYGSDQRQRCSLCPEHPGPIHSGSQPTCPANCSCVLTMYLLSRRNGKKSGGGSFSTGGICNRQVQCTWELATTPPPKGCRTYWSI